MIKVSPSMLACDFTKYGAEIEKITKAGAEYVHLDVMDGVFVPNISFGIPVVQAARKATDAILDVHLMITEPERYIKQFSDAGADIIVFHYEATNNHQEIIDEIHSLGKKAGMSIKPATPAFVLEPFMSSLDLVLVMSVEPGFGGQKLIPETLEKVSKVKEMRQLLGADFEIEIDGGITVDNAHLAIEAGVDVIVAGSAVFKAENPAAVIASFKE
ncbi:MAG: ribulose-phosphate 3-epimerase [Ruminococcaceae bacterium]|nr:ribulose-phosphate 3-epimerase [Oscillospiraceae bacterium]